MLNRISAIGVLALGVMALPHTASAADYYDEGARPSYQHRQDDAEDGPRYERGGDIGPDLRNRVGRGPAVVYDERIVRRREAWDDRAGEPGFIEREHGPARPAYGGPGARFAGPGNDDGFRGGPGFYSGPGWGPGPYRGPGWGPGAYRAPSAPAGFVYEADRGFPDVGCTIEQSQSVTAVGWRKIVTHRTCYRR